MAAILVCKESHVSAQSLLHDALQDATICLSFAGPPVSHHKGGDDRLLIVRYQSVFLCKLINEINEIGVSHQPFRLIKIKSFPTSTGTVHGCSWCPCCCYQPRNLSRMPGDSPHPWGPLGAACREDHLAKQGVELVCAREGA